MAEGWGHIVARDASSYDIPDFAGLGDAPLPPLLQEAWERSCDHFYGWDRQVRHARYCCRPIRITGHVAEVDRGTGEVRTRFSTLNEPDNTLLVACGSRLRAKCPSCAFWHQGDAYQVVVTGLRGGKGMPLRVADHPKVFATLTAPSFGAVHARRVRGGKVERCHPRGTERCPHGRRISCTARHREGDPELGTPLCPECIDTEAQVVWNAMAPKLWHRFWTYLPRELAKLLGVTQKQLRSVVVLRMAKVAEFQRRGVVHFHAVIRIDGSAPMGSTEVAPPPAAVSLELLDRAIEAARASAFVEVPELARLGKQTRLQFGPELDCRVIHGDGEITEEKVASYVAKYLSKGAEELGLPTEALAEDDDIDALDTPEHIRALVWAAVKLGVRPGFGELKLRKRAHQLGFGGHFLSKSLRYSTTFKELGEVRRRHARREELGEEANGLDQWGRPIAEDQVEILRSWQYLGWGYQSHGEAWLAAAAAARAREERQNAREAMRQRRWAA
ncbi:MAG TPA: replication initiator [Actinomycetota bacterium]|nr:replication initiator [Actinomycetota bacterium]